MQRLAYLDEIRRNPRPLIAAGLGSGSGLMLMSYMTTIFGPYLVEAFGWSRAQFALIGLAMVSTLFALPFIGRLTDLMGVRRAAAIGAIGIPLCLLGFSLMAGQFWVYFVLSSLLLIVGSFTSPVVYTRLIAADFAESRGLALTIVTVAPALLGAMAAPAVTAAIDAWGWRAGYRLLALFVLVCSLVAVALIPKDDRAATPERAARPPAAGADFRLILTSRPFWIIVVAMILCTLQTPLHASQMGMMLRDNSLGSAAVAAMISVYSVGTILGRVACGLALDRFSAPRVAALSMVLPALGYALLASPLDTPAIVGFSMLLVGLAVGAEGDLQSFLVARHFDLRIFSTTLSLVYCGIFAAAAGGAMLISVTLKLTDSFDTYLAAMAIAIALGSAAFLLLPRTEDAARIGGLPPADPPAPPGAAPPQAEATLA